MKHDYKYLNKISRKAYNDSDHVIPVDIVSVAVRYSEHQAAPLLADITAKGARIVELEDALKLSHEAAVRSSSLLADVAKVDGDYL